MRELFPVVAGALVGGLVMAVPSQKLRVAAFVIGCVVFGMLASFLSGELAESWAFLSVDMLLVWFGGLAMVVLITGLRHFDAIQRFLTGSSGEANKK
ncbi:MAG TPA: hypothetical protein VH186_26410 [Chloroflexia bacterium]|nr:hypothetical protein [Chloroflexia bacterium]